jgi:hypothetical protein
MLSNPKSIQRSIQIGTRHPIKGMSLLANTFTQCIDNSTSLTKELKIEFCVILLSAIVDRSYQPQKKNLSKRLKNKSIYSGIKLLKRYPRQGLEILVDLIIDELIGHQKCTQDDLFQFYSEIFSCFFNEESNKTISGKQERKVALRL